MYVRRPARLGARGSVLTAAGPAPAQTRESRSSPASSASTTRKQWCVPAAPSEPCAAGGPGRRPRPSRVARSPARDAHLTIHPQTGFEFKKRRAFPVLTGVVVAAENEAALLEVRIRFSRRPA